jgi:uncharacterized membrane protein YcaP (DUF421 family)
VRSFDFISLWSPELSPLEVIFRAAAVYVFIQLLFRAVGRKELGRWGASDVVLLFLIATAARKSIVADDSSLTTAMIGLATIVGLDAVLSTLTARSTRAADLIEGPVRQLVRDGALQRDVMRKTRISEDVLLAHVREKGKESLADVKDAFLERSGKVTVVLREQRS